MERSEVDILNRHKSHFPGIVKLRNYQEKAVGKILAGESLISIVPTGGGKSLIFQLAALELPGMTIVVSPLVALMDEQVKRLEQNGVNVRMLNGSVKFQDQRKFLTNLATEQPKIVYLSPERLSNKLWCFALLEAKCEVSMVVIDEAHCISEWGGRFRPEYSQIHHFLNFLHSNGQSPIIVGLTATISKPELKDIGAKLSIPKENWLRARSPIRKELKLRFLQVGDEKEKTEKILEFIQIHEAHKTLCYLYDRKKCENYARNFSRRGFKAEYFHSGRKQEEKTLVIEKYRAGEIDIIFATTAFGMGMDIPDIDVVIQIDLPASVEEYYQQVGRGARNKDLCQECHCLLLWSEVNLNRKMERTRKEKISQEDVLYAYKLLVGEKKQGKVIAKRFDVIANTKGYDLGLFKIHFIKHGCIEVLGEINGGPTTIRLKEEDVLWNKFIAPLKQRKFNSYPYCSDASGISIPDITNHLMKLEFQGKVEYLPAREKYLLMKVNVDEPSGKVIDMIVKEVNAFIDRKLKQFEKLEELCRGSSAGPDSAIENILV